MAAYKDAKASLSELQAEAERHNKCAPQFSLRLHLSPCSSRDEVLSALEGGLIGCA